jgi:hypothetical protein
VKLLKGKRLGPVLLLAASQRWFALLDNALEEGGVGLRAGIL